LIPLLLLYKKFYETGSSPSRYACIEDLQFQTTQIISMDSYCQMPKGLISQFL
jgi:hypothetical protein